MKLGYNTGYWSAGPPEGVEKVVAECDKLGFEHIWTAEAYGSDALSPLAWWGANTKNVKLGTAIMQMSARTPAATAMAAITMDHLSGGRFILGLGASGPQVVEGWYGQPYPVLWLEHENLLRSSALLLLERNPLNFKEALFDAFPRWDWTWKTA